MTDELRRRPLYSACNEDTRSEIRALAPGRDDTVVCVASGGGRALSLLTTGPARLLAVDFRPSQLHTLELKMAAIDALSYEGMRAFLGLDPHAGRLDTYSGLRASISPRARRYWDSRQGLVRSGVLYAGRMESVVSRFARGVQRAGALHWVAPCFDADSLDIQHALLRRHADAVERDERHWHWLFHPLVVRICLQDPSFRRSTVGSVGRYLYRRFVDFARRRLLRESFLLHLIYFGRYDPAGALPLYLTREGYERARKHLHCVELTCGRLDAIGQRLPRGERVCWSLSDVSCWMAEARFHALLQRIADHSTSGGMLCYRNLAAHRELPLAGGRLVPQPTLSGEIDAVDSSVFYRISVAEVRSAHAAAPKGADRLAPTGHVSRAEPGA